jgi:8-oxo-dGTP pyrophosphatase MutT (NUDIX family)
MLGFRGLPGGRPDKGESDEAAAQREAREESGLEIQVKDLLTTGTEVIFYGAVKLSYRVYSGIITGGELNSQLQGAKFYSAHEVFRLANEEKLLGSYVTRAVARRFAYHAPP